MIDYLQKKGGYTSSGLTREEKKELENLRNEVKKYRELESAILEVHSDEEKMKKVNQTQFPMIQNQKIIKWQMKK